MSKTALIFVLCSALAWSLPPQEIKNDLPINLFRQVGSRNIRSLFDDSKREFDKYSSVLTNTLNEESTDNIETNAPSLFSTNNPEKKHFFNTQVSSSKSHLGNKDSWLAGSGSYFYKPSGSELSFKTNRTNSGLDVQTDGTINLRNNHSLFGSLDFKNKLGSKSGRGIFGYSHAPTGSEVSLKTNKNDLGTDLTLFGKTNFLSNDEHKFKSLFTASRDFGRGASSVGANFDYTHNSTDHPCESFFFDGGIIIFQGQPEVGATNTNFEILNRNMCRAGYN